MKNEKLSRREREKLRYRREMLAAAVEIFSEKGYHNVSMYEIAEKAEFAIGTLYKFFKNKEDLYKSLLLEKAEEYHNILNTVLEQEGDTLTVINNYLYSKAEFIAKDVATFRLYFSEAQGASFYLKAGLDQDIRILYENLVIKLASTLEKGICNKVLRKLDPYSMAVSLEGLSNALLFCWIENPDRLPYGSEVPLISDIFLKGVLSE